MRKFLDDLVRILEQWNERRAAPMPCPSCGSKKVKITSLMTPVEWKCRACKYRYNDRTETLYML